MVKMTSPGCEGLLALLLSCGPALTPAYLNAQTPPPVLRATPELTIGSVDGPDALSDIASLAVGRDGVIHVLERKSHQVSVFSADGTLRHRFGRRGRGPGEFEAPVAFGIRKDTVWLADRALRRVTYYSPQGAVLRTITLDVAPSAVFDDGTIAHIPTLYGDQVNENVPMGLIRMTESGERIRTILTVPFGRRVLVRRDVEGFSATTNPFSDAVLLSHAGSRIAVVRREVASSPNGHFTATVIDLNGDTVYSSRFAARLIPITRRLLDDRYPEDGLDPPVLDNLRFLKAEILRTTPYAPAIASAFLAEDGRLWLQRLLPGQEGSHYIVLNRAGALEGTLILETGALIRAARGEHIWAEVPGPLQVPRIVRYRLTERGNRT